MQGNITTRVHGPGYQWCEEDRGHDTPCWVWQRGRSGNGYGAVNWEGRVRPAHVVAYIIRVGPVPAGLELDHLCRVRECVNPAHLEPVTNAENSRRGTLARLTADDAREIRRVHVPRVNTRALAEHYGVTTECIRQCVAGKTWGT